METLIIAGLAGVGYYFFDKESKKRSISKKLTLSKKPKQTIYQSNQVNQANQKTHRLLQQRVKQSLGNQSTNLVHPNGKSIGAYSKGIKQKINQKFSTNGGGYANQFKTSMNNQSSTIVENFQNPSHKIQVYPQPGMQQEISKTMSYFVKTNDS